MKKQNIDKKSIKKTFKKEPIIIKEPAHTVEPENNEFFNFIKEILSKIIASMKKKKWPVRKILLTAGKYLAFLFLGFCAFILFLFFYYTWDLPKPEKFTETPFIQSTKIYDRTGKVLLYDIYGEEKREIVSFDKISDNLKRSILASEDARFYEHGGIDFEGILRAVLIFFF